MFCFSSSVPSEGDRVCYWQGLSITLHSKICNHKIRFAEQRSSDLPQNTSSTLRLHSRNVQHHAISTLWQTRREAPMIAAQQVWGIIQGHVPRKQWVPSEAIYDLVELHAQLSDEDREPRAPGSITPRWKALVRDVLADELRKGKVRSRKRPIP